jgi:diguanylate cyclase (GGDEF)-like protein/PAS domain S-box-containing protein
MPASRGGAAAPTIAAHRMQLYPHPHLELAAALAPALSDSERHYAVLIEQAADAILMTDSSGQVILANSRACELTGYRRDELVGLDLLETYAPDERQLGRERLRLMPTGTCIHIERDLVRKDGSRLPVEASVAWLPNGERQAIIRDVSARRLEEARRRADERRLEALVRLSAMENSSLSSFLDVVLEEVVALSESSFGYIYFFDEETKLFTLHAWSKGVMAACGISNPRTTYELARTGIWGEAVRQRRALVVNDFAAPNPLKRGYPEGHAPLHRFMTVPVFSRNRIVAVAGVANKVADYTDSDIGQLTQMMDVVWKVAERQRAEDELRVLASTLEHRVDQRTRQLAETNIELEAANSEFQALLREQERLQAELAFRAMHDPLTGLANRMMFGERLTHAMRTCERGVAVVWIDLDRFKEVNDIFGHLVGDEMLVAVADRLREIVRDTDDIARMGGDEFAIVLPNIVEAEAGMVCDRVLTALNDRDAFRLQMGASVGVAWQPPTIGDGPDLVRRADEAMYRAKSSGGGRAVMY